MALPRGDPQSGYSVRAFRVLSGAGSQSGRNDFPIPKSFDRPVFRLRKKAREEKLVRPSQAFQRRLFRSGLAFAAQQSLRKELAAAESELRRSSTIRAVRDASIAEAYDAALINRRCSMLFLLVENFAWREGILMMGNYTRSIHSAVLASRMR